MSAISPFLFLGDGVGWGGAWGVGRGEGILLN